MDLQQLSDEERQLVRRLEDLARIAENGGRHKFSAFLSEREQMIGLWLTERDKLTHCALYGGYPQAERKVFGAFAPYQEPEEESFPIRGLTALLPKEKSHHIGHRDVLGALMSLGIKREFVGDILVREDRCDLLLLETVARPVTEELRKIGGVGVRWEESELRALVREERFEQGRGTVSSPRLDSLVGLLAGVSRERSAGLIRQELVRHNHRTAGSVSAKFEAGDVISIRGYGKFRVAEIGAPTKKGRLPVVFDKYS